MIQIIIGIIIGGFISIGISLCWGLFWFDVAKDDDRGGSPISLLLYLVGGVGMFLISGTGILIGILTGRLNFLLS